MSEIGDVPGLNARSGNPEIAVLQQYFGKESSVQTLESTTLVWFLLQHLMIELQVVDDHANPEIKHEAPIKAESRMAAMLD